MTFEYFDIHSHLYFKDYDKDREHQIEKLHKAKVGTITIGTDYDTSKIAVEMAKKHSHLFACIGQHPGDLKQDSVFDDRLNHLADNTKVVAIGECGLDYFRMDADDLELKSIQKTIFEYHIDLALEKSLPLMLHIRSSKGTEDAYNDALTILGHHANISGNLLKGNVHFFAGSAEVLKRFLAIGFTVSFTGVITFTDDFNELIKSTPLSSIMAETDSPFVAPVPHRKERNSPEYVSFIVEKIAEIRGEPVEVIKEAIMANIKTCFPRVFAPIA